MGLSVARGRSSLTEADDPVPVEVNRREDGSIVAARVCWTNDVDELDGLEGTWREVARLSIGSGMCLVWDPYHGDVETGCVLDVVTGDYVAEAFYTESDCLGLRIINTINKGAV